MDLRQFYQAIQQQLEAIAEKEVVVVSKKTGDGGREGTRTEVTREAAARMIVESRARLASAEETAAYHLDMDERRAAAQQSLFANRVQVALVSDAEIKALKQSLLPQKS